MIWIQALLLNGALIALAQRAPVLTAQGWIHAGALGTILWGCLGWQGWTGVVTYLILGSLVTRIGFRTKQKRGLAEGRGGRRGPENVWGSAATGAILALLIGAGVTPKAPLLVGFAASFSAKLADTFGSEIGKRWGGHPVLITTLRPVPSGTDGAISLEGTLASAAGSGLMTVVMLVLGLLSSIPTALVVMLIGLIATLAESLIGALAQDRVRWLSNELVNAVQTLLAAVMAMVTVLSIPGL